MAARASASACRNGGGVLGRLAFGLVGGLRTAGSQDLAALVLTLLAERRQGDGLTLGVEHVRDPPRHPLAREPQFPKPGAELPRQRHPEHVPSVFQPGEHPTSGRLPLGTQPSVPGQHFVGELNRPSHI
jgi:hypothetical protein